MDDFFDDFILRYRNDFSLDVQGNLSREALISLTVGTDLILKSLKKSSDRTLPVFTSQQKKHLEFAKWILELSESDKLKYKLHQPLPPEGIHYIPGQTSLFYDIRNTDIMLEEFHKLGIPITGRLLDFGCSSGRNLATLERCFDKTLDLYGVDPALPSINWAKTQFPQIKFQVNQQEPPLLYLDEYFDFVIAKSIWTHFSEGAAKRWFSEIARILKVGGHFFFSTHGPHDIAYRLTFDIPKPKYKRFSGASSWTKEAFLSDAIKGLDKNGFYFQPYKDVSHQGDISNVKDANTSDWGLAFMTPQFLVDTLLPTDLKLVSRTVGRTGNRHDVYIVRKI